MEQSMADLAIDDDDESGVPIPNMETCLFLGNQLPVSRLDPNILAFGHTNYQDHNHATKSSSVSTIYATSASHSGTLSHPAGPFMITEGKLITPIFD
ncbi:hypothetical protein V6N13_088986 [Hibiscus sabdariffa]